MDHFSKFLVVGTLGFTINTLVLIFGVKLGLRPSIASPIGSELAIISNFFWNNYWTFSDRSITSPEQMVWKFIQFNILSFGSVVIQFVFLRIGEMIFGMKTFKEPFVELPLFALVPFSKAIKKIGFARKFSLYFIFYMGGVGVGLVVNFLIYSLIIWK